MTKKEVLEAQGYKTYENEDIQVFWKPRLCEHVGECARGNYNVFNPQRRPWVDVSQAPAGEIADIIDNLHIQVSPKMPIFTLKSELL